MHLMFSLGADGKRIYTLKKVQAGEVTKSAHPARFSPDDKYSRYGRKHVECFFKIFDCRENADSNFLTAIQASCDLKEAIWVVDNSAK